MKELIQSLLKDRNLLDQFLQGRMQFEGISSAHQGVLRDLLIDNKPRYIARPPWM